MSASFLVCAAVTIISALISLGYSIAAVAPATGQARALALYACARSVALTIVSAAALLMGSSAWLQAAAVGMIIVQILDAGVGVTLKDNMKIFGPAGVAIANLAAFVWLVG